MLFKNIFIAKGQDAQARTTATGIVKAYNLIGYDAVAISSRDLAGGIDFLLKMQEESLFPWLSANLVNKKSGKTLFKSSVSVRAGSMKIAIIGLTDNRIAGSISLGDENEIKSWQDTLPGLLPQLAEEHQFLVLLTSLSERDCRAIAKKYPSIDLIIQASGSSSNRPPQHLSRTTLLASTDKQGKYIGVMDINWQPGRNGWDTGSNEILAAKINKRDRFKMQLARFKSRPKFQARNKALQSQLDRLEKEIDDIEKKLLAAADADRPLSSYKNHFMAMEISMPDHPDVLEVVNETKRLINRLNQTKITGKEPGIPEKDGFIGWRKCRGCHPAQTGKWQRSRHASAFLTLIEKDQQFNLNCLPCHVTGVDIKAPAAALTLPSDLQLVGCESCHGPGQLHIKNPTSSKTAPVTEEACLQCHTPERDDSFNFIDDLKKLKCR